MRRRFPYGKTPVFFCRSSRWSFSVERRETGIFSAYGYVRSRRFSSRLLSIRAGGAKASPASSLFCTSNSRACGISTKPTCTIENCWNTGAILLRGWHHQFRGVGGMIGNSGTAAHAAVPELPRRITPRRWKIPASRRNTFTRRMNCGMMHLYPTIMPWGEAALTAPGLVGQAPPRLRFAGAGLDADMTPCGTGRKTAPAL